MRIISKFKDYYDGLTNSKDKLVYERHFSVKEYLVNSDYNRILSSNNIKDIFKKKQFYIKNKYNWNEYVTLRMLLLVF